MVWKLCCNIMESTGKMIIIFMIKFWKENASGWWAGMLLLSLALIRVSRLSRNEPRIPFFCEVCPLFGLCKLKSTFLSSVYGRQPKAQQISKNSFSYVTASQHTTFTMSGPSLQNTPALRTCVAERAIDLSCISGSGTPPFLPYGTPLSWSLRDRTLKK